MTRNLIFLGLWAVLPAPAQVGIAALYTQFQYPPPAGVLQAIQDEVNLRMAPNGLHFDWRTLPEPEARAWPELAVVTFMGRCDVFVPGALARGTERLGWTHFSENTILPFAEVDCNAILDYIYDGLWLKPPKMRERILGRAIGRVTAHELLHVFSGTPGHGDHGVDHPSLTAAQLLADSLAFDDGQPPIHILHSPAAQHPANQSPLPDGFASYVRAGCANCHGPRAEGSRHAPQLRVLDRMLNPVILAAKLAKSEHKMCLRARDMKLAPPSLDEGEISELIRFLNNL